MHIETLEKGAVSRSKNDLWYNDKRKRHERHECIQNKHPPQKFEKICHTCPEITLNLFHRTIPQLEGVRQVFQVYFKLKNKRTLNLRID